MFKDPAEGYGGGRGYAPINPSNTGDLGLAKGAGALGALHIAKEEFTGVQRLDELRAKKNRTPEEEAEFQRLKRENPIINAGSEKIQELLD